MPQLKCIFCDFAAVDVAALKQHSATCAAHPAVKSRLAMISELREFANKQSKYWESNNKDRFYEANTFIHAIEKVAAR